MATATKKKAPLKKAKPTRSAPVRVSKITDEKYIGSEITKFDGVDIDLAIKQNLKHCNYFYTRQDAAKWIEKWVQKNLSPTAYREFRAAETWRSCLSFGTLCRMHSNGAPLPPERIQWIKDKLEREVLKYGRANVKATKTAKDNSTTPRLNPAMLMKRKADQVIADIEAVVDSWDAVEGYSLYAELKSNEIPAIVAKAIGDYYAPVLAELKAATARKPDEQLKHAYKHFTPANLKKYLAFIEAIVTDVQTYLNGKKAQRKPRAKKEKSAGVLVKNVKYQKESKELKLTSIDPTKIIGAAVVLLFNTKYNTLSYLVSNSKIGFTITGTTIQNLDNEQSFKKTLRKASENIQGIVAAPKAKTLKLINDLKTTRSETTGRINEDTIIVKVYA